MYNLNSKNIYLKRIMAIEAWFQGQKIVKIESILEKIWVEVCPNMISLLGAGKVPKIWNHIIYLQKKK